MMAELMKYASCPGVHALLAGSALLALTLRPPIQLLRSAEAGIGTDTTLWILGGLVPATAFVAACCRRITRRARRARLALKTEQGHAQAAVASYYPDEALEGCLTLTAIGARVEAQKRTLAWQSAYLVLAAMGFLAGIGLAAYTACRGAVTAAHGVEAIAVCGAMAALALATARSLRRTSGALEPTPAQVHAATLRYHQRQEQEKARERDRLRRRLA